MINIGNGKCTFFWMLQNYLEYFNTCVRWVDLNVGNLNCIFPARLYPSGQSFRPGVPRIDAILYNWSISDVPKIEVLDILMKIINLLLLCRSNFFHGLSQLFFYNLKTLYKKLYINYNKNLFHSIFHYIRSQWTVTCHFCRLPLLFS